MRKILMTVLAAGCLALTGCGAQDPGGATTSPSTPAHPDSPDTVTAELTITVDDGAGGITRHTLTCGPAGGDHPDPEAACAALTGPEFLEPVPADAACTAQYGGPQTATVTGTLDGSQVDAEFRRTDGCQISRWDRAAALLGAV